MKKKLLFIAWDNPNVNYLQGLFIPIFSRLKEYDIHIIQFTWADEQKTSKLFLLCKQQGITYTSFNIVRKPFSMAGVIYTLIKGKAFLKKYIKANNIDIVMPRSTMPALMVTSILKHFPTVKLVFDADGLPLEERVDFAGLQKNSRQYKYLKSIEKKAIQKAQLVLTRTTTAIDFLTGGDKAISKKFYVVINGRDSNIFKPADSRLNIREGLGISNTALVVVYAGSLGPQYCAEEMLTIFKEVQKLHADSYLLLLTPDAAYLEKNIPAIQQEKNIITKQIAFTDMPAYLSAADVALALRKNYFSMKGVAPIKIGEYLLCGLPVIVTPGTGDVSTILQNNNACFLLNDDTDGNLQAAAEWALSVYNKQEIKNLARETGIQSFSLDKAVASYVNALNSLS